MDNFKQLLGSKTAVLVLFALISTLLAIPLVILLAQEKQDIRQYAAEAPKTAVKGAMTSSVSGYIYMDSNRNGQRDSEEKPYPNATVRITTKENTTYPIRDIRSDSFGYFMYRFETGTAAAQIKLILPDGYKTSTSNPLVISRTQKEILEFGVVGNPLVTPKPSCMIRPACLDSVPRCLVAEPATGWCPTTTAYPTKSVKPTDYRRPIINKVTPTVKL